jgi:3-deoxy-D-manno-octulosonate 8-phosphate phosphatase (KDO 8-P phosphatase)
MKGEAAKRIKLVIFDVDGVLTNGQIVIGQSGEAVKQFHAQDGQGITLAHQAGLKTAIITGRESRIVYFRSMELKITDIYQGISNKIEAFNSLMQKYQLAPHEVCYVGDDLNDLPVMIQVGLACAVANAVPEVKAHAGFIATHCGGQGAVREVIEFILKAQQKWDSLVNSYLTAGIREARQ